MKKQRNQDIVKSFKREINLNTRIVKDKTKSTRKEKHKMKFKDFVSENTDAISDFQMTYDDRLASVSKQKDKLEVKYFQRYDIKSEDRKAVKELAKKLGFRGLVSAEGQSLIVKAR